jgi:cystathionine beta-lyase/cystathionine gamma-synthase
MSLARITSPAVECSSLDSLSTVCIRGGQRPDPTTGAILTPIVQSTTFVQPGVNEHKGFTYSRAANPTVDALERALGAIEDAPPAVAFATGMAAITTLFLSLLKSGDHVLVSDVVYGGTVRLCQQVLDGLGINVTFVDTSNPAAVKSAITPRTALVFVETPANPTLKLTDIQAVAAAIHEAADTTGPRPLLAVDNTFLTPVLFRPLDLGADITVYSTTKYIEGHNATVGGSLSTRDPAILDRFRLIRKTLGCIQAPQEAWLTIRGLKTLPLRIERHSRSAQSIAEWLERHPRVNRVLYPGLESFPQHALAKRQHPLHGGILSFEIDAGVPAAIKLLRSFKLCSLAESLGAVETLVTHPVSMTHGDVPRAAREAAGITDGLIRLSVGLEDPRDIIADLEQAIAAALDEASPALSPVITHSATTPHTTTAPRLATASKGARQ